MKFTLRQLEVFTAVARHESVSQAAVALAMSQSAASTALGELERSYATPLFDRVGKRLRLNETGALLRPLAIELLDRAREADALLDGRSGIGTLRVGATLTIGNYLAPLILAAHLQHHSESRVELHVRNTKAIVDQVAGFDLDLGLIEGDCEHPDLVATPWLDDELTVFCAPTHPLCAQSAVSLDALRDAHWILREPGSGTRKTLDRACAAHGFRPHERLVLEHTEAIKRAVESGLGIGCISRLALREAFRRGSLAPITVQELDLRRRFQFVWHARKHHTPGLRTFIDACRALTAGARHSDEIALPYIP